MKKLIKTGLFLIVFILKSCSDKNEIMKNKIISKKHNGEYHGKYIEVNKNGDTIIIGFMNEGKKIGLWKYYDNDTLMKVDKYIDDKLYANLDYKDYVVKGSVACIIR